jgi:hypothetical protein
MKASTIKTVEVLIVVDCCDFAVVLSKWPRRCGELVAGVQQQGR